MISVLFNLMAFILPPRTNLVFFSGGNSLMPNMIYTNFLEKLSDIATVTPIKNSFKYTETENILNQLLDNQITSENTYAVGHSSGATTLLNQCARFNVRKCVLLDPVDNNKLFNKDFPDLNRFGEFLIIKAENSYRWAFKEDNYILPNIKVPFIPFGDLNTDSIKNKTVITFKNFGHCDILDQPYSNYMHDTFAKGSPDRSLVPLYKKKVVEIIELFLEGNLNDYTLNATMVDTGIEYSIS